MDKKYRLATAILVLVTTMAGLFSLQVAPKHVFSFQALDVGQGDAILVTTPGNARILIDGGPDDEILRQLGQNLPLFSRRLDLVVLTHPDADHLTGLVSVLQRYDVGLVLHTGTDKDTAVYQTFSDSLKEKPISQQVLAAGDTITISDGTTFKVLWPKSVEGVSESKINETSLVMQLSYGGYDFLLTGDIGEVSETQIAAAIKEEFLDADVLKVPHHGSKYSSSDWFLSKVTPRVAVVSVSADNFYGHPASEALARLEAAGARVFRTDTNGRISIEIADREMHVKTAN